MKEVIENLLDIDAKARQIMVEYQEKKNNLDYYISEELAKRKEEINYKYNFRMDFYKKENARKLETKKNAMKDIKDKGIIELKDQYFTEKKRIADNLVDSIINSD